MRFLNGLKQIKQNEVQNQILVDFKKPLIRFLRISKKKKDYKKARTYIDYRKSIVSEFRLYLTLHFRNE